MIDQLIIVEIALRGAAAGLNILLAGVLLLGRPPGARRLLGALFAVGTAAYALVSADHFEVLGPFEHAGEFLALYNTVFFWWFARSLFEDAFRWSWVKIAPVVAISILHAPLGLWATPFGDGLEQFLHSGLSIALLTHAVWIALHDRDEDLVDPRRRFRLAFAVMVGAAGIVIAIGENIYAIADLPEAVTLLHAAALFVLTFFFASWLLTVSRALLGNERKAGAAVRPSPDVQASEVPAADKPAFGRLTVLMDEGVYREEGLTVARLAEKVGVPEHRLRRLINRELGFRNFTAFLNARRIEDAKAALADPAKGRRQVLQIALDLGYGSVAPFNRAFKQATGQTPTEFRKSSLQGG